MINSPCHYCADRTLGCHGYCFNYMKYVTALKKEHGERYKSKVMPAGHEQVYHKNMWKTHKYKGGEKK